MALAVLLAAWMPGIVFGQTRLTVEVTNGTADGASVVGDEVTLQLYKGQEPIRSLQVKIGEGGKAVFEGLPTGQEMAAVARARHQNMAFHGQPVLLAPGANGLSASVQVFDVSTDTSKLSVGTHHIMIAVRSGSLEITEYMQLRNSSDMAVTGSRRDDQDRPIVIEVKLPESFEDLAASGYFEQPALVLTPNGFYDTMAVPPGEHQVMFSYKLDIDRGAVKIAKEMTLPTAELTVFWEHGQGTLEGLGGPNGRLANAEGLPLEYYQRNDLKPGDRIAFQICGFTARGSDTHTWIILAAVFAAIVVVALLRLRPTSIRMGQQHG
ncbi:MAG: hypothetical protein A2Y77_08780 [Planctomycetes bacterium RBG_13_62_9]|nr:MAG: hypothetical protein A2Y77_08780 [Planctomycetes bacterium RBG_13_62_9]